jgi:hypothetical protein
MPRQQAVLVTAPGETITITGRHEPAVRSKASRNISIVKMAALNSEADIISYSILLVLEIGCFVARTGVAVLFA